MSSSHLCFCRGCLQVPGRIQVLSHHLAPETGGRLSRQQTGGRWISAPAEAPKLSPRLDLCFKVKGCHTNRRSNFGAVRSKQVRTRTSSTEISCFLQLLSFHHEGCFKLIWEPTAAPTEWLVSFYTQGWDDGGVCVTVSRIWKTAADDPAQLLLLTDPTKPDDL